MPIASFSDAELDQVLRAARPLPVARRAEFMTAVAKALAGREVGPGAIHQVIVAIQRQYFEAPRRTASYRA